jgi:hypothetical protein
MQSAVLTAFAYALDAGELGLPDDPQAVRAIRARITAVTLNMLRGYSPPAVTPRLR